MSLWAEYIEERNGLEMIESEHGFITFKILGDECYIEDAYVRQSQRKLGVGSKMLGQIEAKAKSKGCKFLTSFVRPNVSSTASTSMAAQLAAGFKIRSIVGDKILMVKEL